jgi:hypothetical protein
MNASSIEKMTNHISNSWILSCSILGCGILTCAYLNGINNIPMKRKNRLELEYPMELVCEKIKKEDKLISYYWNIYKVVFITGMTGLSVITLREINKK